MQISSIDLLLVTPCPLSADVIDGSPTSATLGEIWQFTLHRSKVSAEFREVQNSSWRLSLAAPSLLRSMSKESPSVANYFCNCSPARAAKDAAGRNHKIGWTPDCIFLRINKAEK